MDHMHFQSAKRPFSVIFNSKRANQVIRYRHEDQVSRQRFIGKYRNFRF